jgi:hypothetical protein
VLDFEVTVSGGLGTRLLEAYPEFEGLRPSHVRLVAPDPATTARVVARLQAAGVAVVAVDERCGDWQAAGPMA